MKVASMGMREHCKTNGCSHAATRVSVWGRRGAGITRRKPRRRLAGGCAAASSNPCMFPLLVYPLSWHLLLLSATRCSRSAPYSLLLVARWVEHEALYDRLQLPGAAIRNSPGGQQRARCGASNQLVHPTPVADTAPGTGQEGNGRTVVLDRCVRMPGLQGPSASAPPPSRASARQATST